MRIGNPINPETQIGPLARKDILDDINQQLKDALNKGANLCYQMQGIPNNGYFFAPCIVDSITSEMDIYHNETFGPLFSIFEYSRIKFNV